MASVEGEVMGGRELMEGGAVSAPWVATERRGVNGDVWEGNAKAVAVEELRLNGGEDGGGGDVVDGKKGVGERGSRVAEACAGDGGEG